MTNRFVLWSVSHGVATLTLNRPEVLNSCNRPMVDELRAAFADAGSDAGVRAVLLTGAGRPRGAPARRGPRLRRRPGSGRGGTAGGRAAAGDRRHRRQLQLTHSR